MSIPGVHNRPNTLPTTAMILAAGLALRMRPLTDHQPKALLEVGGKALIDHTLDALPRHGISRAVVNVHHMALMLEQHLARRQSEPEIIISNERTRLMDTGGGVKQALPLMPLIHPLLIFNGKCVWTDGPRHALYCLADVWDAAKMDALLLLCPIDVAIGYDGNGDFDMTESGQITSESKDVGRRAPYVFTGIQMLNPATFQNTPDEPFSMRIIWSRAIAQCRLYGVVHDGSWMQVWNVDSLQRVKRALSQGL